MKVPGFPSVGEIPAWKIGVAKAVQSASGRRDHGSWLWIGKASDESVSFDSLGDVPSKYVTLNHKTSQSIQGILKVGDLKHG